MKICLAACPVSGLPCASHSPPCTIDDRLFVSSKLFSLWLLHRCVRRITGWSPALDLYQSTDNFVAVVELPGMCKEDVEISLHDGTLTISGERKRESVNGDKPERTERYIGTFRRSIALPTRVDASKVNATYRDGILIVRLPKAEEVKPKQIQVS